MHRVAFYTEKFTDLLYNKMSLLHISVFQLGDDITRLIDNTTVISFTSHESILIMKQSTEGDHPVESSLQILEFNIAELLESVQSRLKSCPVSRPIFFISLLTYSNGPAEAIA